MDQYQFIAGFSAVMGGVTTFIGTVVLKWLRDRQDGELQELSTLRELWIAGNAETHTLRMEIETMRVSLVKCHDERGEQAGQIRQLRWEVNQLKRQIPAV